MIPSLTFTAALLGLASASPLGLPGFKRFAPSKLGHLHKRQVPQEHSHDFVLVITREFLNLDNPKNIQDPVFGLLGDGAAAAGAGDVTNLACLKQETADQAFTNAKAAGDLRGMAGALLFQAIERNTAGVGVASKLCTEAAVNPEIGALTQHQDAASENAGALNKAITLELAKQLAGIGADPNLALLSGTFAPGDAGDATGKGNSCDTEEPELGCIFSEKLLVLDASEDEIAAAVADVAQTFTGTGGIAATDLVNLADFSVASVTGTVDLSTIVNGGSGGAGATGVASGVASETAAASDAFTGTLGGPAPPVVSSAGDRPFAVNGNTFTGAGAAISRSCDIQHNACANAANSGELDGGIAQCETQVSECKAANSLKKRQAGSFGSCSDPSIIFAAGLDGRTEEAFAPSNDADFNHGSAQKIGIIADFICQRLGDSCKADADVVASCTSAAAAAKATTQDQAAADVFNAGLGVEAGSGDASGNGGDAVVTSAAAVSTGAADAGGAQAVVMTITQCA
ncbi:uncharacterized protein NECHADRAFT_33829 [Fusarium vanettenii 77-13-4]|uniref:Cell wall mannoprotein n=1 Tax=Fusarium vanettenii (strain ATCC MYA-4622 / CBS 123669 / FGSC 9596 / NRRL 45880 / 77-13-4) TaxID=660122 RepID=C7Z5V8_FUSV7|nr:uncharacterized protein NECHADRAFT_33829 [Fusarium vanettenii 77-13-4]EEU40591.1 hypothetical protein NECHADRAFT_33829 [Fusarium vanettenii 77-13-4]